MQDFHRHKVSLGLAERRRFRDFDEAEFEVYDKELCLEEGLCPSVITSDVGEEPSGPKPISVRIEHFLDKPATHIVIMCLVMIDMIIVASELAITIADPHHEQVPKWVGHSLEMTGDYILIVFFVETILHIISAGVTEYFRSLTHAFDFAIVMVSFFMNFYASQWAQFLLLTRLWRVVRVMETVAVAASLKAKQKFKLEKDAIRQESHLWKERYFHEREKKLIAVKVGKGIICLQCHQPHNKPNSQDTLEHSNGLL
ncbi:cation channel family transporter [Gregarina niphandrodes]|uniref:Voltage-gated hydrogen channel 1 n=1 Tax=Gregarina niphandrodes TaxID=110365 RepID=A0A023BD38_GRENI|nr:cation channel family transporter [Gregarina niphandrodes]EZG86956.1 cation channel family transporter [Gregarina niphandrodes]|eukprot:XP_011128731.1 cation channel family transporter [Gregarina niphandrodes]